MTNMRKETECVHRGSLHDAATGGVNSPIYPSTAAEYLDRQQFPYPRYFNAPNQAAVVEKVAALEGAEDGVLFASGMAAISTLFLSLLNHQDHLIASDCLYGPTEVVIEAELPRFGMAPPAWWLDQHPDARMLFDDGKTEGFSMASQASMTPRSMA